MRVKSFIGPALFAFFFSLIQVGIAQSGLPVYNDNLVNGFQDWSWITRDLANASPVHAGSYSISATGSTSWPALSFYHASFNASPYASLTFWAHGGSSGGQQLQVYVQYGPGFTNGTTVSLPSTLAAGTWKQYTISLSALGVANRPDINRINLQLTPYGTTDNFYVDDISLTAAPVPSLVHVAVDANAAVRTADARWFGLNTAIWDSYFDTTTTSNALKDLGCQVLRFPGGSASDEYHWATGKSLDYTWSWVTSWSNFVHVATNARAQVFITVNYGTGTSNEAAAWVKSANITNHCGVKYWEIGNECYGTWETDYNNLPHDPYTYAQRAAGYIALMKAADPTIKIGVVATPGETSYSNNPTHFVINPRTGATNYGWTPVMLTTLKNLGVTPDFIVHHFYPEYTDQESDPLVLQAAANWAADAADLRQQITDYFGSGGDGIELLVTENNSNAGQQGRQSTSIVNALYYADSLAQLMKTEFNSFVWWDLRNGLDYSGNFDSTLYGWRTYGDLGIMPPGTTVTNYPSYYGMKLMQHLVHGGDTVLDATSDYLLLSAYAGLQTNGDLTLLVVNKDATSNLTARIALSNFAPASTAIVRSYGIAQDEAVRTNGPVALQNVQSNSVSASAIFTNTFPPYSLTLFTFTPNSTTPIATTLSLASGANPSTYGNTVTLTATVRTNGVAAGGVSGGTVTFYNGTASLGAGTLNSSGQASYATTASQLTVGNRSLTAGYPGNGTYGGSTNSPAFSQTVNPATLTASLTGTVSKNYNGTTAATLAAGNYALSGVVGGDTVTLNNPTSGTYNNRNVGSGKTVNVTGLAISGASATNYTLASSSVSGAVGTISQTNITVTGAANSKTYDGTIAAGAAPTITTGSLQPGDTASFTETYDNRNQGAGKTLTPAGAVSDGNSGNNYNYTFTATANGTIIAATLTYTANSTNKVYGAAVPVLTGSASGFVGTDTQGNATTGTLLFTTPATSTSDVGSYAIDGSGLTANFGNYTFMQAAGNATALTVAALPVNLTGARPYDGTAAAPAGILSVANTVGADDVIVASGSGTLASTNVGVQPITSFGTLALGGATVGNYTLSGASGSVTILPLVTPVFVSPAIVKAAEGWQLYFSAQTGQTYQIIVTADVTQPVNQWAVLTNGTSGAGTNTVTDSSTNLPMRFYRIVSP